MSPRRNDGFTILELMVALTAGLILVSAVYYVGAGSARHFQEQQRIAQTQMNVRMAMENLRADIARAGYLGTPSSEAGTACPAYTGLKTQAVEFADDADLANIENGGENLSRADRLRLVGNYASGDEYFVWQIEGGGTVIVLQPTWQGFRRSFVDPATGDFVEAAFEETFLPGRAIRLTSTTDFEFFGTITARDAARSTVTVSPALPVPGGGDSCIPGFGTGSTMAPLSRIEYSVQSATSLGATRLSQLTPRNTTVTGQPAYLVRREIDFTNAGAEIAGSPFRTVLEWATDFEVDFVLDNAAAGAPPALARVDGGATGTRLASVATTPSAEPEDVRSIIVQVAGRTPEQDALFPFMARASADDPMRSFRAFPDRPGAARVRSLRSEIYLPNLAR